MEQHYKSLGSRRILDSFAQDPRRLELFTFEHDGFYFDFSKNRIDSTAVRLFKDLARDVELALAVEAMFCGERINVTEGNSVLHTALRNFSDDSLIVDDQDILEQVRHEYSRIQAFSDDVRSGNRKGYTGKPIRHIVNIGIGGSHLGPQMVVHALKDFWSPGLKPHFVANIDGDDLGDTLEQVTPEETLFIISSKTFTTLETMTNARAAREWFVSKTGSESHLKHHFVAVTSKQDLAHEFGISDVFLMWDWVGGRYSLWSSIGISIACMIGFKRFDALQRGAHAADLHLRTTPFEKNIPFLMAITGIGYNNFENCETYGIFPYSQRLRYFPAYLQQVDMESNGKGVDRDGNRIPYQSGPIGWGDCGTNGQHAFFQLLHQGTKTVPSDFIIIARPHHDDAHAHRNLVANAIAQSQALMIGKAAEDPPAHLREKGLSSQDLNRTVASRVFPGNIPSTTIMIKELTPYNLGYLTALYEHKIFVQGIFWNIFSFDQWGVELGKTLGTRVAANILEKRPDGSFDDSTKGLVRRLLKYSR